MTYDDETTGQALRRRRRELGLTQDEVAARAGITRNDVSKYENDRRPPGPNVGPRLVAALESTPSELWLRENPLEVVLRRLDAIEARLEVLARQHETGRRTAVRGFDRIREVLEHLVQQQTDATGRGRVSDG